ncbi:MAG: helix-turn-helix domain-containing protein [Flavobacteriales bacterium]|nr:helix-turn-helix domain-containing protein [Flavobacteriales bacterium]
MLINNADTDTILDKVYDEQHLRKASRNIVEIEDKKGENKKLKGETYLDTWNYFKAGKSIEEIATERSLAQSTIEGHLAKLIKEGKIDVSAFLSKQALDEILRAINICQSMQLSTLRTNLMNKYSYGELRFATAYFNSLQNALDKE